MIKTEVFGIPVAVNETGQVEFKMPFPQEVKVSQKYSLENKVLKDCSVKFSGDNPNMLIVSVTYETV